MLVAFPSPLNCRLPCAVLRPSSRGGGRSCSGARRSKRGTEPHRCVGMGRPWLRRHESFTEDAHEGVSLVCGSALRLKRGSSEAGRRERQPCFDALVSRGASGCGKGFLFGGGLETRGGNSIRRCGNSIRASLPDVRDVLALLRHLGYKTLC
jgi:hypothetical protein